MERKVRYNPKFKNNTRHSTLYRPKRFSNDIDIRGEVFIQNNDFEEIKDSFANPRNAASGSLRQKDPKKLKIHKICCLYIWFFFRRNFRFTNKFLIKLKKWGFKISN